MGLLGVICIIFGVAITLASALSHSIIGMAFGVALIAVGIWLRNGGTI